MPTTIARLWNTAPAIGILAAHIAVLATSSPARGQQVEDAGEPAAERLTVAEFEKLHAKLAQMSTEKVWSIPWHLSVRAARERAAREKKPVFLWISSNGGTHPLGPC